MSTLAPTSPAARVAAPNWCFDLLTTPVVADEERGCDRLRSSLVIMRVLQTQSQLQICPALLSNHRQFHAKPGPGPGIAHAQPSAHVVDNAVADRQPKAGTNTDGLGGKEGRGRNGSHLPPPAQIRTCRITAYGSCLGF